jgi:hypothetical protein
MATKDGIWFAEPLICIIQKLISGVKCYYDMNDLGIVLYKVCVFVPVWNSTMATTILENE